MNVKYSNGILLNNEGQSKYSAEIETQSSLFSYIIVVSQYRLI